MIGQDDAQQRATRLGRELAQIVGREPEQTKRRMEWWGEDLPWEKRFDSDSEVPTHRIYWRPEFIVDVAVAPWEDPDEVIGKLTMAWNDNHAESSEAWTEHEGDHDVSVVFISNNGSVDESAEVVCKCDPLPEPPAEDCIAHGRDLYAR
jgi:hypothetical protein